ncbi:TonB-dependent receptor [Puteibacter caeruleilacunae]|nr:TonB-dependent receptor [Puteibacter caeruleilacunae]
MRKRLIVSTCRFVLNVKNMIRGVGGVVLFVALLQALTFNSYAQMKSQVITGTVTSVSKEPIPGVSIAIDGTTIGTVSDFDGKYSIKVNSPDQVLIFTFIGMEPKMVKVGEQSVINVVLDESNVELEEVVAVGYGTMKKSDVTGAVASVRSEDIVASGGATIEQALAGRTAGVIINNNDNAPGAGLNIKIRGTNSINASSAPLYVIDGFPVEGSFNEGGSLESSGQSPLAGIDPNDIESIDILKDASATAIYGARGANGVVIVTTKSGRDGKMKVSFSAKSGVQQMIKQYKALDAVGYAKFQHHRYFPYDKRTEAPTEEEDNYKWWNYETYKDSTNTNWMDEITQMGEMQNYNLSVSGGNQKGNYLASVGYYKNKGIVKETDFTRYTGNFKATGKPNDWLELAFTTRFSFSENNGTVTINSEGAANYAGILQQGIRTKPLKSPNEAFLDMDDSDGVTGNPLATLKNVDMLRENFQSITNASVTIIPWKDVRIKSLVGMTHNKNDFYYYAPSTTSWGANFNGRARITNNKSVSWLNENTVSVNKKFGDHRLNALAGFTVQSNNRFSTEMEASNFPIEVLGYQNISVGESYSAPKSHEEEYLLLSYLGRVNYNYKNKYLVTGSFRADGSSKFAENNKWGYFPSIALAWRVSEESFLQALGFFDNLKLRAGWGETGNPNIAPYQSLSNYGLTKYPTGEDQLNTGVFPINTGNPNLMWETSVQSNVGLDLAIFDARLSVTIDAYLKETKDLLLKGDIPPSLGFDTYLYNSGKVKNKGIEVALNGLIVDRKFKWTSDFNIAFNKNEVTDLGELTTSDWLTVPGSKNYSTAILKEGEAIGLWYGYETDGLWQQSEFNWNGSKYELATDAEGNSPAALPSVQPGMWKFKDLSGPNGTPDGKIDAYDKKIIGKSQPKFTGGLNNRFEYGNFDLAVFMEWSYGRDIYNANNRFFIEPANSAANTIDVDYWLPIQYELDENGMETDVVLDPGNPDGRYPGPGRGDAYQDMHNAYIEDGSYLRIKNVTLGYKFKPQVLKSLNVKSMRLYVNILNLYTFTNYSGYDPNVNAQNLGGLRPGYDYSSYPLARTYMVGVNVDF